MKKKISPWPRKFLETTYDLQRVNQANKTSLYLDLGNIGTLYNPGDWNIASERHWKRMKCLSSQVPFAVDLRKKWDFIISPDNYRCIFPLCYRKHKRKKVYLFFSKSFLSEDMRKVCIIIYPVHYFMPPVSILGIVRVCVCVCGCLLPKAEWHISF